MQTVNSVAHPRGAAGAGRFAVGVLWSGLNAGAGVALPFLIFIFFARHLRPADVGVVVLATSIAEIIKAFGAPGLYEALLQQREDTRRHHETAAAALIFSGMLLFAVYVAVVIGLGWSMPVAADHPLALALIGLRITFDLATLQPQAALAQRLSYRRMAVRSVVGNVGAGLIGVGLALCGEPLPGLVAYLVAQSALVFLATVLGADSLARPHFSRAVAVDMAREATAASVVRLVAAVNNYLDQIVVSAGIGSVLLAYFNLGKRVETTFITAASSFSAILFQPLFSREPVTARAAGLRRGLAVLTMICGAPCAFFVTNAESIVRVVFGLPWLPAAPVAAVLALSGFVRALGSVHGALLSVSQRNRKLMTLTIVSAISGVVIVLSAGPFGIVAVAAGLALKNAATVAWMAHMTRGDAPRPLIAYASEVVLPFGAMFAAGVAVRDIALHTFAAGGLTSELSVLASSGCAVAACGLLCLARHVPRLGRRVPADMTAAVVSSAVERA
jgi:PST family polysaccharide transporter